MSLRRPKITERDLQNMDTILEFRENPILAGELLLKRNYAPIQRYAMWGMWHHAYSMLDWGRGCGKCVSPDTVIHVRTRSKPSEEWKAEYLRIEDLFNDYLKHGVTFVDEESWRFPHNITVEVRTYHEDKGFVWVRLLSAFRQKIQRDGMVRVKTLNGRRIFCTPQHAFYVAKRRSDDKARWVPARDLMIGQDALFVVNDQRKIDYEVVVSVEPIENPDEYVYDLAIADKIHSYLANNILTHNTTVASDVSYLSGMLYPGTFSLVVSHSMKGVKLVFDELNNTYMRSELAHAAAFSEPTFGSDLARLLFRSVGRSGKRTKISGVAPDINKGGQGIRGQRASRILHIDEWVFLPPDLIDGAILPCASNSEDPMAQLENDEDLIRRVFTSSSGYSFDPAYTRMSIFRKKFMEGDPDYFYCNANYLDMPKGFIQEKTLKGWIEQIKVPNPGKFETEIMAHWTSEAGSWYRAKDVMGDPEKNPDNPGGMWMKKDEDPEVVFEWSNHSDYFVLGVDPAQQQDQTALTLIKVLPHRLVIMGSWAYDNTDMIRVAEEIRKMVDRYNIVLIAMDPDQGGRSGVTPELNRFLPHRTNTFTGKKEAFIPIYEVTKDLPKGKEVPAGVRQILEYVIFSPNSKTSSVTEMNLALRQLIQSKTIVVPLDPHPQDKGAVENIDIMKEGIHDMMRQIVAIEAEPQQQGDKVKGRNAVGSGKFTFITKNGMNKDRWASCLIAAWKANFLQQQINVVPDNDGYEVITEGNIFDQDPWGLDGNTPWYGGWM